jgi:F-type H+-transporting ATPase subunit gamma
MTDTLESLRRKISGAQELGAVVRTMKALAASKIGQYEDAVRALRQYYRTVELGLAACLRPAPPVERAPPAPDRAKRYSGAVGAVVFGSDQGLVGQFNDVLADYAGRELAGGNGRLRIWAIGERIQSRLTDAGLHVERLYPVPNSVAAITPLVTNILADCEAHLLGGTLAELHVIHNRPVAAAAYERYKRRVLPLDASWRAQIAAVPWPTRSLPEVAPAGASPLTALIYEYLFVSLFQACAESLASENASRLAAMQRAEHNIRDVLADLTQSYHRVRQSTIDDELFDVLAGYEALEARNGRAAAGHDL